MTRCTAQAWLVMASGGRWTLAELRAAMPSATAVAVDAAVRSMVTAKMVHRYAGTPLRFGITASCIVPRGMTVGEVMRAVKGDKHG